ILGVPIWDNSPGFLRITVELNVLGMLIYLVTSNAHRRWVITAWLGCWLLTAGAEGYRLHLIDQARITHAVKIVGVSPSIDSRLLKDQPFVRKIPN
ncbi:MAG: hypothetical protein OQJ84_00335, partial [Xanthomonadales bacterium]|nr:hypothetical protein [Xanthomonadales bacterium]